MNLRPLGYEDGAFFCTVLVVLSLLSFRQLTSFVFLVNTAELAILGGIAVSIGTK